MGWTSEEKNNIPPEYGCEIILENTSVDAAKNPSFPNDAYLIWYKVDGKIRIDLCRTKNQSSLFDMYYDKFGPNSIQKIDWGYGRVNPKLWGYVKKENNKKR